MGNIKNAKLLKLDDAKENKIIDSNISKKIKNVESGGKDMSEKFVTHNELELSNEKILHEIDNKFHEQDKHVIRLEGKLDNLTSQLQNNNKKIDRLLDWLVGGILIGIITTLLTNLLLK